MLLPLYLNYPGYLYIFAGYSQSLPQSMYRSPAMLQRPQQGDHLVDSQSRFIRALSMCFEQLKNLEKERKKASSVLIDFDIAASKFVFFH